MTAAAAASLTNGIGDGCCVLRDVDRRRTRMVKFLGDVRLPYKHIHK